MTSATLLLRAMVYLGAVGCWASIGLRPARADEPDAKFQIKNTLDEKVSVYVASEKSTKSPPWVHAEMEPGAVQTILLHAPDPYTVMVDVGAQRSLSKPIPLKEFLGKHPDYVLNVNISYIAGTDKDGKGLPGQVKFNFVPNEPPKSAAAVAGSAPGAKPERLDFGFQAEREAPFHVKNNLDQNIGVWVASEKSTKENPWAHLDVKPGEDAKIDLLAPDKYTLVVDIGNQRGRSKSIALKAYLDKHPNYVLTINTDQTLGVPPEGTPLGGYTVGMSPPRDAKNAKTAGPDDYLDFAFKAEKQQ